MGTWIKLYCQNARKDLPKLLTCDQNLVASWHEGWDNASFAHELDNCPVCVDRKGFRCPTHG